MINRQYYRCSNYLCICEYFNRIMGWISLSLSLSFSHSVFRMKYRKFKWHTYAQTSHSQQQKIGSKLRKGLSDMIIAWIIGYATIISNRFRTGHTLSIFYGIFKESGIRSSLEMHCSPRSTCVNVSQCNYDTYSLLISMFFV